MHSRNVGAGSLTLGVLLAGIGFAVFAIRPPAVIEADAAANVVSGARAMAVLHRLATAPHPPGSAEHTRVRDLVAAELAKSGLAADQNHGVFGRELNNIAVSIRGTAPTGTVLCMAHYDSVARGPGAGDDGAGVVCWLEALRALQARGWRPRNDVLLLLTDGEELGLLGAHLFARTDPRAAQVKVVINLEAIGNGGPAYLFELGPRNGARVREYAAAVAAPAGSSFAEAVYHRLPNNTDLSVFLKRGVQGFNLALPCGSTAYHAPHDTPDNVDPRSLQHMAASACALAERLGGIDLATLAGDDVTFFDGFGFGVVAWPRTWDPWLAVAGMAAAAWLVRRTWKGGRAFAAGLLRHVVGTVGLGAIAAAAWWGLDRAFAACVAEPDWVPGNTTTGALLFAGAVLLTLAAAMPRGSLDPGLADRRQHAGLAVWSAAALAACFVLPGAAFALTLPVLCLALGNCVPPRLPGAAVLRLVPLAATLLLGMPILHLLVQLGQREPLVAVGLACVVGASFAWLATPQLLAVARAGTSYRVALWLLGATAWSVSVVGARVLLWRGGALLP